MNDRPDEDLFYTGLQDKKVVELAPPIPAEPSPEAGPRPISEKNLFSNPDTHPVVLDMALLKTFHLDWFPWLGDTLFQEIETEFKTSIAEVNKVKIMAVQNLHGTDVFWDRWEIFEKVINTFGNSVPLLHVMQPPDVALLMSGVEIANQIRKETFAEEVARYTAACFLFESVHYAPPPCDFAQPFITQPLYRCKDCGKTGSSLAPFTGTCPSCTEVFDKDHPFAFKPNEARIKEGKGQNLSHLLTYDPAPTRARFEELSKLSPEKLPGVIREEAEDIQAEKLLNAVDYCNYRQRVLTEQLSTLRGFLGNP